ncbi:MAG: HlyD family efflux transporter periplasmic adaptor subunit [Legionella sp.]|nr:HlyD family efflux transporter periplasmic adaptor subunit [Legionella sp.]
MKLYAYSIIKKLPNAKKVAAISCFVFIAFLIFLILTPWQQFAIGKGRVIAYSPTERQYTVNAPVNGRIHKWYVNEGDKVKVGELIVAIADNDPKLISRLELERNAVLLRIDALERSVAAGESNVIRQKKLYELGISSKRKYELAQIEYAGYQSELAKIKVEKIDVEIRLARQKSQVIKASANGIIFQRVAGQENVIVKAGEVLARIVPSTDSRAVALWVDGNDIPFVRLNQKARLQFEGWPAIQFRGWPGLAVGTFEGKIAFIDPTDNGQGLFRTVIIPTEKWPDIQFLRQGVLVHGWVQLGRVPLWYELWRQFNGFPPVSQEQQKPVKRHTKINV